MTLSIIIPYYNAEKYTKELLACLDAQMNPEVEVILIDDGSAVPFKAGYEWLKVKRKKNGGASSARNAGLDMAQGDYIAFIDSDDMVAGNYVQTILDKIRKEKFDYCYISWRTLPGKWNYSVQLKSIEDKFPPFNLCVWNRIYKKEMIGNVRFNTKKAIAEDAEFIRDVKESGKKKAFISEFMYYYRSDSENSLTKRFADGRLDMHRIIYNIPHVTSDMAHLIKEFKEADKYAEVILMTKKNELPELEEYAMVIPPKQIKGTELRGEQTKLYEQIVRPEQTQVVIWTSETMKIGGIETWIYNFVRQMHKYYDIIVLYDKIDISQLSRLTSIVECRKNNPAKVIQCDTIIVNRISDSVPKNIKAKQKVQMVHACKMLQSWTVPDADRVVTVSEVVAKSFGLKDYATINNMTFPEDKRRPLMLISATRTKTFEKGQKRMAQLGKLLDKSGHPYIWLCFTDGPIPGATSSMVRMDPRLDISSFIKAADYLVQLSDMEGFCYSVVEALELGTPVIVTPLDILPEIGVEDKVNAHVIPFDLNDETDITPILEDIPVFEYKYDNAKRVKQWRSILGNTKPKGKYNPAAHPLVLITKKYYDTVIGRDIQQGEQLRMSKARAVTVCNAGFGTIMEGKA